MAVMEDIHHSMELRAKLLAVKAESASSLMLRLLPLKPMVALVASVVVS
jgi:hypothetical protein